MRHVERGPELGQPILDLLGSLPVPFRGRGYPQREQQFGRWARGITGLAEDRMKSLLGQVRKNQVDDAPGIEGLFGSVLAMDVHAPEKTSDAPERRSQLETVPGNLGFTL